MLAEYTGTAVSEPFSVRPLQEMRTVNAKRNLFMESKIVCCTCRFTYLGFLMDHSQILDSPAEGQTAFSYGGFWIRLAAYLIDAILLSVVQLFITFIFFGTLTMRFSAFERSSSFIVGYYLLVLIINWLYFSLLESSANQATIGKLAVGVRVVGSRGQRITFLNATGRYFAKIISAVILFIGFIMAGFDARRQALHDKLANTFVVVTR
jgi:uncharacterized RDD family membrane protein YckC